MAPISEQPADSAGEPASPGASGQRKANPGGVRGDAPSPVPMASAAVQAERERIAQAMHDTVSQSLTGTYLQALVIARKLEASHSEGATDVARLAECIHQAVVELQEIVRGLQPETEPPAD